MGYQSIFNGLFQYVRYLIDAAWCGELPRSNSLSVVNQELLPVSSCIRINYLNIFQTIKKSRFKTL